MKKIIFFFNTLSKKQLFYTTLLFLIIYYCFGLFFSILYTLLYLTNTFYKNRKKYFVTGKYFTK